jgi:ubiquinone biosynthesis protein Coq4
MPDIAITRRFEAIARSGEGDPAMLAAAAKRGDMQAAADLAALLTRAGWVEPRAIIAVYDAAAAGWFGDTAPPVDLTGGSGGVVEGLWPEFWAFLDDPVKTDPGTFTLRTAGLGKFVDGGFARRAGEASLAYPGVAAAVAQGWPQRFTMGELAECPDGSLGNEFHRQIVDNNFDLEVLDRDALGLASLPPPLDYLNVRILQCHDLWHIVGGYHTTALHEVGISAFQLSQFGHNYSAQFLAFIIAKAAINRPEGFALLMEITLGAWRHGRSTPQLLGVNWQEIWDQPTDAIRQRLGVSAYISPVPPDLVEQLERAGMA